MKALKWSSSLFFKNIQWEPCLTGTAPVTAGLDVVTVVLVVVAVLVVSAVATVLLCKA